MENSRNIAACAICNEATFQIAHVRGPGSRAINVVSYAAPPTGRGDFPPSPGGQRVTSPPLGQEPIAETGPPSGGTGTTGAAGPGGAHPLGADNGRPSSPRANSGATSGAKLTSTVTPFGGTSPNVTSTPDELTTAQIITGGLGAQAGGEGARVEGEGGTATKPTGGTDVEPPSTTGGGGAVPVPKTTGPAAPPEQSGETSKKSGSNIDLSDFPPDGEGPYHPGASRTVPPSAR